jgi:hypothetical protein
MALPAEPVTPILPRIGVGLVMDPAEIAAQVRTLGVLPDDVRSILTGQLDALARGPAAGSA